MNIEELALRRGIIDSCKAMNASGINQGTSGNISARYGDSLPRSREVLHQGGHQDKSGGCQDPSPRTHPDQGWQVHKGLCHKGLIAPPLSKLRPRLPWLRALDSATLVDTSGPLTSETVPAGTLVPRGPDLLP